MYSRKKRHNVTKKFFIKWWVTQPSMSHCLNNINSTIYNYIEERHMGYLKDSKIRSLRCHHDQLVIDINQLEQKPLIIALCETWLCDNDYLNLYHLEGYYFYVIYKHPQSKNEVFLKSL